MTKLYALDLRPFEGGLWRKDLDILPTERRERALSCRKEHDGMRIACAGYLLRHALLEEGIESPVFAKNEWGKPFLADRDDLHFSLSHSGHWALCAISNLPVGVDVELPRCTMAVAKRHFRPDELENIAQLDSTRQADALNRFWTAKEAFAKMLGRGLTLPLGSFSVRPGEPSVLEQSCTDLPYRLHEYCLEAYRVCLCSTDDRPKLEVL